MQHRSTLPAILLACLGLCSLAATAAAIAAAGRLAHHPPQYLAACLLLRDASRVDVREWVEYHLWAGVDKIFLFDHNSRLPVFADVVDYALSGRVQYTYLPSEVPKAAGPKQFAEGLQGRVFNQCFLQGRGYFTWMMFTDLDEYMLVTDASYNHSIPAVLREYESTAGAVLVHRVNLGSGGLEKRAEGEGMLQAFTSCMLPPGEHLKGIAHLGYASISMNAHMFAYEGGRRGARVGDNATVGSAHRMPNATSAPLVIYHYTGAVAEYTARVATMPAGVSGMTSKSIDMYRQLDAEATESCTAGREVYDLYTKEKRPSYGCDEKRRRQKRTRTHDR
ncbi:hypothetical protein TSOC_006031 [Tetrabaena socialis]|uniref:Glycosyltransferase family 92 protein n=1 Tax=Tetrabaena socialis TaxID=47790 RepID=A0A2J8A4R4_9CHLO|nr:hypothetical protein TSOC_006031 [Tetrabaena socialis]|eukprot:PNH07509.1 hypothetical protein TSOC_006031 [Tetrabaena socialis]